MSRCDSVLRSSHRKKAVRPIITFLIVCTLGAIGAATGLAQASVEEFHTALSAKGGLTKDDLAAVERGEIVIRLLPVVDKREVAVCGVVRLRGTPDVIAKAFRESLAQQGQKSVLAIGSFSDPPTLVDVEALSLENRDIEDLKRCTVGKCEMKLSTAMIARFHQEVNWASPDYQRQASRLFRQMLVDYVRDYQARGAAALLEYHDQSRAISIGEEQQMLLDSTLYLSDFTPEFVSNVKKFPHFDLSNIESSINWTKLKFGLKPVIIVTHTTTYKRSDSGAYQILSLSNQIYANHYFDSSLALTTVISFPKDAAASDCYLLYANHSRADSLAGSFSRVKRSLVEEESIDKLNTLLLQAKANLEVAHANHSGDMPVSRKQRISDWLFRGTGKYAWLLVCVVIVFLIALSSRYLGRIRRESANSTTREGL
jgi:hypothetical protein